MNKGYVQLYTGNGKGKTTAAIGLALRAIGAGLNVFLGQFAKKTCSSEIEALKAFKDKIRIKTYGSGRFITGKPDENEIKLASDGLKDAYSEMINGKYDVVILDEAAVAVYLGLISSADLIRFLEKKPVNTELVITGRNASAELINAADLVTEMREIKHYYSAGVNARTGIEM
jgi:cob(I)alamin adenosyltransferase